MRLPASSKAYDAEQTLPFPPGGRNTDRIPIATSFVKRRSFNKRYFNTKGGKIEALCPLQMFLRALQWLKQAITQELEM